MDSDDDTDHDTDHDDAAAVLGGDLASRAELVKLARALGTTPDGVGFASSLGAGEIRLLRERIVATLYDEHREVFRRIAAISRTLPTSVNVRITLRAFSPLLAARIAGEMPPDRAAALVNRMPVEYLAEGCVHLDPRRAEPLISRIEQDRALAVVQELVRRDDFITLGRLLDASSEGLLAHLADAISDDALLRIGGFAESGEQLTRAIGVLSEDRLRGLVRRGMTGPPELRAAGLAVMGRLTDGRLRSRLAEYAAAEDEEVLVGLLLTALDSGAVGELLTAVAAMTEPTRRRVANLPALDDPVTRKRLTHAAIDLGLGPLLARLAELR
jgi:hypothetical protein